MQYEQIMTEYFSRRDEEKKKMRRLVEEVMEGHHSAQEARVKLQEMKHRIGKSVVLYSIMLLLLVVQCCIPVQYSCTSHLVVQQVDKESQELMARALEEVSEDIHVHVYNSELLSPNISLKRIIACGYHSNYYMYVHGSRKDLNDNMYMYITHSCIC